MYQPLSLQVLNAVSGSSQYPVLMDDNNNFTYISTAGLPYYLGGTTSATYGTTVMNVDPANSQTLTTLGPSWGTSKYIVQFARSSAPCAPLTAPCWVINGVATTPAGTSPSQTVNLYSVPADYQILKVSMQSTGTCTPSGTGNVTVSVGDSAMPSVPAYYTLAYNLSSGGPAFQDTAETSTLRATTAASTIQFTVMVGSGNVNNILAGCAFNIWVDQKVLQ
jgi:hypothetical protein